MGAAVGAAVGTAQVKPHFLDSFFSTLLHFLPCRLERVPVTSSEHPIVELKPEIDR